ncbi:sulfotransferase family protein [Nitrosococcus wardiae]|nr:sulfotransferase [Nitrosococcus wardiae]
MVETPPVKERTIVRVVNASEDNPCRPGFLIGVYRSGTTLLRFILDSHPNIAVPPETNFLTTLSEFWDVEWNRKGLQGVGVDEEILRQRLRRFAGSMLDDYTRAKGKRRWFDKTPSYIDSLNFIDAVFGVDTQYIMLYRHGLDVAASLATVHGANELAGPAIRYTEEYERSPRLAFVRYWRDQCEKMLAFEDAHHEQCFRVYYEQYVTEPEYYLKPLFKFLGEQWESDVLNFSNQPHDFGLQDHKVVETKQFKPSLNNYRSWPQEELAEAREIAGPTLEKLGYTV